MFSIHVLWYKYKLDFSNQYGSDDLTMTQSRRIILNTLATYGRSLVGLAAGLFSARWILQALGKDDFGLYGVVGSLIVFLTFFNNLSSVSVSRFYAFSIGKGNTCSPAVAREDLNNWFNKAISVHWFFPALLILIGYPIGIYAIRHWLVIPPERFSACLWVFRFSLLTALVNIMSVPYVAMYTAHQYITELAVFGIFTAISQFVGAYLLLDYSGDRLIAYSVIMMMIFAGIPMAQVVRAYFKFSACRVHLKKLSSGSRLKKLLSFAGWQAFGGLGAIFRNQGIAILINLHFPPSMNAAYSVANQVAAHTATLSGALQGALTPAITSEEGAGKRNEAITMAYRACKFSVLLVLLFAIPLLLEMNEVLVLWLGDPPDHAPLLCSCMILVLLIDKLSFGHIIALSAQGRIALYQIVIGSLFILTLPLAWLGIRLGGGVKAIVFTFLLMVSLASFGRVVFCKIQLNMSISHWAFKIVLPLFFVFICSCLIGFATRFITANVWGQLCVVTFATLMATIVLGWRLVFDGTEREYCLHAIQRLKSKFLKSNAS